jgi:AraC-like DNA-binding protein
MLDGIQQDRGMTRVSEDTAFEIARAYRSGIYVRDIGRQFGIDSHTVCNIAKRLGMTMRGTARSFSEKSFDMADDYSKGVKIKDIASKYEVSERYVLRLFSRMMLPMRKEITHLHDGMRLFLKARRIELGFTQKVLSKKVGVDDRRISRWERGVATPTVFNLKCWKEALGVDDEYSGRRQADC